MILEPFEKSSERRMARFHQTSKTRSCVVEFDMEEGKNISPSYRTRKRGMKAGRRVLLMRRSGEPRLQ
jgi:hypothetical protein